MFLANPHPHILSRRLPSLFSSQLYCPRKNESHRLIHPQSNRRQCPMKRRPNPPTLMRTRNQERMMWRNGNGNGNPKRGGSIRQFLLIRSSPTKSGQLSSTTAHPKYDPAWPRHDKEKYKEAVREWGRKHLPFKTTGSKLYGTSSTSLPLPKDNAESEPISRKARPKSPQLEESRRNVPSLPVAEAVFRPCP